MDERHEFVTTSPATPDTLTTRQREVVGLIAEGLTNAEIGHRLGVTRGTAANHVEAILRRLGTSTRVGAAMWGVVHRLVSVAPPQAANGSADGVAVF